MLRVAAGWISVLAIVFSGGAWEPLTAASRPPVRARHGMVVTTSELASQVGVEILQAGGNAVDAAVAVGFALAVVHPQAGNLGGGGFMVIHGADSREQTTIDYRETAPAAASRDMYLDESGEVVEGLSTVGHLAAGIPGSVAGMHLAWSRYGKLPWAKLVEPSIRLARDGFVVSYVFSRSLRNRQNLLSRFPETKRVFLKNGEFWEEGEIFRQPELAWSLKLIAKDGPDAFYKGPIAAKIVASMEAAGGLMTAQDLAGYQPTERAPVRGTYRGHEIVSMGPPSSGGIILVEMLNMMERFPLANLGVDSSETIHLKTEVMRRAFADRAQFLGDPDFSDIPAEGLVSKTYARNWATSIERNWASPSGQVSHGDPLPFESPDTTHYSVVDAQGNAVATTTTINGSFGSGVTVEGAGFLLNNEMDDFSSKPGVPNAYGLIQGEANAVGPGKRPLSAMTPTLVLKDGKLLMVLGSPGGPTIINTVFQIVLNVIDFGMDIQEAVDAPRIHHQWLPDRLVAEHDALVRDVEISLQRKGHRIENRQSIGDAHCILIDPETGIRYGAPDPRRGESLAVGY